MAATDVVNLAEAKRQVNIDPGSTSDDDELAVYISAASEVVDDHVGPVVAREVVEIFDGGRAVVTLSKIPVLSITSVTDSGTVLDSSAYKVAKESGVLTRVAGVAELAFLAGIQNVQAVYQAGRFANTAAVTGRYKLAGLIILQHMWETQRPAGGGPFSQGSDDYDPRYSYSIPRRALELLGEPIGGIA